MVWTIKWRDEALRDFKKIDKTAQKKIRDYLMNRISTSDNPRQFGKPLSGTLSGLWRYRVGNYRIVCKIEKKHVSILIVRVAHRSRIYKVH